MGTLLEDMPSMHDVGGLDWIGSEIRDQSGLRLRVLGKVSVAKAKFNT